LANISNSDDSIKYLFDPKLLEKLEKTSPGFTKGILKEIKARRKLRKEIAEREFLQQNETGKIEFKKYVIGTVAGVFSVICTSLLSFYAIYSGNPIEGATIASGVMVALASVFVTGRIMSAKQQKRLEANETKKLEKKN